LAVALVISGRSIEVAWETTEEGCELNPGHVDEFDVAARSEGTSRASRHR
jgi:hypothetical protein